MFDLDSLRALVRQNDPELMPRPQEVWQHASVAMIFAGDPRQLSLSFILRADRAGDRWSGQMAFPGGRAEALDETAEQAASRETLEEVGLSLEDAELIGRLSDIPLRGHGGSDGGVLSTVIYYLGDELGEFSPDPREVARAYWISVDKIYGSEHATTFEWELDEETTMSFPGISHDGQVIWGLTFRVLAEFSNVMGLELPLQIEPSGAKS